MILSETLKLRLKDLLAKNPLKHDEMRRIEGLGELYLSLVPEENIQSGEYTFVSSYRIGGIVYNFYSGLQSTNRSHP